MLIYLRITTACIFLVLFIGVAVLWGLGFYRQTQIDGNVVRRLGFKAANYQNSVKLTYEPDIWLQDYPYKSYEWMLFSAPARNDPVLFDLRRGLGCWLGFQFKERDGRHYLRCPHWFLALATLGFAILLKPKPRYQFTLKDLVVLTTMLAIACGTIVVMTQMIEVKSV